MASQDVPPERAAPAELKRLVGDGVGLDRMIALTRDLHATSSFFTNGLGFQVTPGQVFGDGFAVHYVVFHERPLLELLSIYDRQLALEKWGDVEARFLERHQGGFQIGIGVSDISRARRLVERLGLPEQVPLGNPAQAVFTGEEKPPEDTGGVVLAEDLPAPYAYVVPVYFTNYTHVARTSGRDRRPEDRHPALRDTHPNSATGIVAAYLAVDDLEAALSAYRALGFTSVTRGVHEPWGARSAALDALDAEIVLLEPLRPDGIVGDFLRERGKGVGAMGICIAVQDLALAQSIVEHNTGRSMVRYDAGRGPSFLVPPDLTSGVFVEFLQE